jgi:macrolide-specific efflux system membrane fusion protein
MMKKHNTRDIKNRMRINQTFFSTSRGKAMGLGVLASLMVLLYFAYSTWASRTEPSYVTEVVKLGSLERAITSLGNLQPKDYVDVGTQVSGQLKKVHVAIGDTVKKGQLLAEIDPTVYATKVDADRASLADLRAQLIGLAATLKLSTQEYKRVQVLHPSGAASQKALDEALSAYTNAKAAVASIKAQVMKAESTLKGDMANLGYTKIYAPAEGTVVSQTVLEGQTINSSQSAPTILRIANLDVMTLNAEVAEADVSHLRVGMPVYFTTLGHSNRRWESTIRQIMPTPTMINNVVLYTVLVDVENKDRRLMTQMTAQVFFVQGQAHHLPLVPLNALRKSADGQSDQVQVLTDNGVEVRKVKVVLTNRSQAAIASGVKPGEQVIVRTKAPANSRHEKPNNALIGSTGKI